MHEKNWILNALMPFRKLIYFPPNIDVLKKIKPQNESEKSIFAVQDPIQ